MSTSTGWAELNRDERARLFLLREIHRMYPAVPVQAAVSVVHYLRTGIVSR